MFSVEQIAGKSSNTNKTIEITKKQTIEFMLTTKVPATKQYFPMKGIQNGIQVYLSKCVQSAINQISSKLNRLLRLANN